MGKTFDIPAGSRTRVLRLFSSSVPGTVRFSAQMEDGSPPAGRIEVARWRWFIWQNETLPLQAENTITKGFADADYHIHVTPDRDCRITFQTNHFRSQYLWWILAAVLILGLVSGITATLLAPPGPPAG